MKSLKTFAVIAVLALTSHAFADDISLGEPSYGGTGCPAGTASATLSPDQKSLSILFDEFYVEAGGATGRKVARKNCNIAIPVHVPQGFSVSLIDVDYRGYTYLPNRRAKASFSAQYFFAGSRGPRLSKHFYGYHDDEYIFTNNLVAHALVWSPCGADVNLRVNAGMMVRNMSRSEEAIATVDSADVTAGIVYKIQWRRCNGSGW